MDEFKNQLIGQKDALVYALDLLKIQENTLTNAIKTIEQKLKEIK